MKVKLTKRNVNAYKFGEVYDLDSNMANYLIGRGLGVEVKEVAPELKEDKQPHQTKEEKFIDKPKTTKNGLKRNKKN
jgi:ribosomal protein L9